MLTIGNICSVFERFAPLSLQEDYDNSGLILGDKSRECTGVMFCLDVTEEVVAQSAKQGCNLIIAHHPLIFNGLKKVSSSTAQGRTLINAIKQDLAVYACHTNIDNVLDGVNGKMADKLGLINRKILLPKAATLKKLVVFVPSAHSEKVEAALFEAGAGNVGNYSECSFVSEGTGSFLPGEQANPFMGAKGSRHSELEKKIEVIFPSWIQGSLIDSMRKSHPYEEIAYEVYKMENMNDRFGSGLLGELKEPITEDQLLARLKNDFKVPVVRHSPLLNRKVSKIAICGGAGAFLIRQAKIMGADVLVTADLKYHDFFEAENQLVLADIGHFESEQYTIELFMDIFKENFPTFAHLKNHISTNPVNYSI